MILIADSGSTKTDWLVFDKNFTSEIFQTIGLNPFFKTSEEISEEIKKNLIPKIKEYPIDKVFFYGAGCSTSENIIIVENGLKKVYSDANIEVNHDILGAALACCTSFPSIACILGTGSNSVLFDGEETTEKIPSLGHLLGDEGSGFYFGQQLLKDFLYKKLPKELSEKLQNKYGLSKEVIFSNIYGKPNPNRYIASFAIVYSEFKGTEYVEKMLRKGFQDFLKKHVMIYENYENMKCNFVGSIAYNFESVLKEEAEKMGINVGNIVKKPILGIKGYLSK